MLVWFALEFSAAFSLTESAPKVEVKKIEQYRNTVAQLPVE